MNAAQVMKAVCINQTPPDMSLELKGCPEELPALMKECCAHDPSLRPPFTKLLTALDQLEASLGNRVGSTTAAMVARTSHIDLAGGGGVGERLAQLEGLQKAMALELSNVSGSISALKAEQ